MPAAKSPRRRHLTLGTLAGLVLCNLIWALNPVAGKILLAEFAPIQAAWLRYATALAAYALATAALKTRQAFATPWAARRRGKALGLLLALGFLTFFYSPASQLMGLARSRASDNALIIAMEPLFTVFLAWAILREKVASMYLLAFGGSLVGFSLLTGLTPARAAAGLDPREWGDVIMVASLLGEAASSSLGRLLMEWFPPRAIFGAGLAIGVAMLTAVCWVAAPHHALFHAMSVESALAVAWLGPIGTTVTYLYWMHALEEAPVASLALTLFVQPVAGAIFGVALLGEHLLPAQILGGVLIFGSVLAPQVLAAVPPGKRHDPEK